MTLSFGMSPLSPTEVSSSCSFNNSSNTSNAITSVSNHEGVQHEMTMDIEPTPICPRGVCAPFQQGFDEIVVEPTPILREFAEMVRFHFTDSEVSLLAEPSSTALTPFSASASSSTDDDFRGSIGLFERRISLCDDDCDEASLNFDDDHLDGLLMSTIIDDPDSSKLSIDTADTATSASTTSTATMSESATTFASSVSLASMSSQNRLACSVRPSHRITPNASFKSLPTPSHPLPPSVSSGGTMSPIITRPKRKNRKRCKTKRWEGRFQDLLDYKEEHGHCDVAYHRGDDPDLVQWVKRQRYHFSLNKAKRYTAASLTLTGDRIADLDSIGFVWSAHDATWDANYRRMCAKGAVNATASQKSSTSTSPQSARDNGVDDSYLATWMRRQRRQYKSGTLSEYRVRLLNQVGFDWDA